MEGMTRALPSALTLAGLLAGLAGARCLATGEVAAGVGWLILGQLLDILDGVAARRLRAETPLGALLDYHSDQAVGVAVLAAVGLWAWIPAAVLVQTFARDRGVAASGRTLAAVAGSLVAWGAP